MSIYEEMRENWRSYCIMSAIAYIQEMSKPHPHIQIKKYKDKKYRCTCFNSIVLQMKDEETTNKFFALTKKWEKEIGKKFIGVSFDKVRKDRRSGQDKFSFTPGWLNHIISECGKIPNVYSFESAKNRINHLKHYKKLPINKTKNLFKLLLKNKYLAAGAFIISMDLECRGLQSGRISLCMSEKYKDFLNFMLKVAQKWGWTNNYELSPVNIEYSKKIGINASSQFEFRLAIKGLQEIYSLAGPLANSHKDKCTQFHVNRSKNYKNLGGKFRYKNTKGKILNELKKKGNSTSTKLQFTAGVGIDVVLNHLHSLEKQGKIKKERKGKRYVWNII